jgi:hypothetical protein
MRRGYATVSGIAALATILACGSTRPPPLGDGAGGSSRSSGGFGDGGTRPPGCGTKDDGSSCECIDAVLTADPTTIYFVLDRSGSMTHDGKWDSVRTAAARLAGDIGSRASFGAAIFPGDVQVSCSPGVEVMSVRPGDPPGTSNGPTVKALVDATNVPAQGGTPTAATLAAVLPTLRAIPGKTFVILATDGAPNCNPDARCSADLCVDNLSSLSGCPVGGPPNCCAPGASTGGPENCIDDALSASAVSDLAAAGFPTYVIGLGTDATDGAVLDQLAVAGGTALPTSPKYVLAADVSVDALVATLKKVAAKITGACTYELKNAPADPNAVNVYLDEVVVPKDPTSGWTLEGTKLTLLGSTCARVENGDVLDVRIIVGCPTVLPR